MNEIEELVSFFCTHLVPIEMTYEIQGEQQTTTYTAFVISVGDQWFLLTAGHCLEEADRVLSQGHRIVSCRLIDTLGLKAIDNHPIPFPYDSTKVHYYYQEGDFDYGLIPLTAYFKELLERNNVKPLTEEVWKKQPSSPEMHVLLGIPAELTQQDTNGYSLAPTVFIVQELDQRPASLSDTEYPHFYGRLLSPVSDFDIRGMSGGPIFAIQHDQEGRPKYWIVALQSSWNRGTHEIKACPVQPFGLFLEEITKR